MPRSTSKKQWRLLQAILHGKAGSTARGDHGPPKSIAAKFTAPDKDAPESKGKEHKGGRWDKDKKSKKKQKDLKKNFQQFYKINGVGIIILNEENEILAGLCTQTNQYSLPGGHLDNGEDFEMAAKRELLEETGLTALELHEIGEFNAPNHFAKTYVCTKYSGSLKNSDELKNLKFHTFACLVDKDLRDCSAESLKHLANSSYMLLKKTSIQNMYIEEKLSKVINRGPDGRTASFEVTHGDSLKLVGNGLFRIIREITKDMNDEDFKEAQLDTYKIHIRKHINDIYSGRVYDGIKMVHQFVNKSLPSLTADLMSVFEWYLPEDEMELNLVNEDIMSDDHITGGLETLVDNYKKHNISNIYTEMENIRKEIRNDNAVDLQVVEAKIMKLFDKLEDHNKTIVEQHNKLCQDADKEIESIQGKLRELQSKVDELSSTKTTINAYSSSQVSPNRVYDDGYMYLSKPQVIIEPNGRIRITFSQDWNPYDKENFLSDMKAKIIKKRD